MPRKKTAATAQSTPALATGRDFKLTAVSPEALDAHNQALAETSRALSEAWRRVGSPDQANQEARRRLSEAQWRILRAETSCNFFWGEAWLHRCHRDLDDAWAILNQPGL